MGAAAVPMAIGSAIGAATSKNPLQGAILGGFLGGAGGALLPTMSTLGSTASGILPSAASGSMIASGPVPAGAAFLNPAGVNAMTAATTGPTGALGVEAMKSAGSGIFSTIPQTQAAALQSARPLSSAAGQTAFMERPLSLSMPGVEPGQGYEYTLGDRLGQVGQFAQKNPVLTQMAAQTGQSLLNQQPTLPPPAGLMRGNPTQMQPSQYQVGIPRVSLI